MFTNAVMKHAILALTTVAAVSAAPLKARDHDDFNDKMLEASNWYRSQHGASPLSWDDDLADFAANHARSCSPDHSNGPYGENMASSNGWSSSASWANLFGHERIDFDFDNGGSALNTGHFTQLVWKNTDRMGCGWAQCADGYHIVCEYASRGNVVGDNNRYYRENVGYQISGNINDEFQG